MKIVRRAWWKIAVLAALPLVPLLAIRERRSWMPRTFRAAPQLTAGAFFSGGPLAQVEAIAWSPDGSTLAVGRQLFGSPSNGERCEVQLWNLNGSTVLKSTLKVDKRSNYGLLAALIWASDGRRVAAVESLGNAALVQIWNVPRGAREALFAPQVGRWGTLANPVSAAFEPGGGALRMLHVEERFLRLRSAIVLERRRVAAKSGQARALHFGKLSDSSLGEYDSYPALALSQNAAYGAVVLRASSDKRKALVLIATASGTTRVLRAPLTLKRGFQPHLALSPNGQVLALSSDDKSVVVIPTQTGVLRCRVVTSGPLKTFAISPNAELLATWNTTGILTLWNARSGTQKRVISRRVFTFRGSLGSVHDSQMQHSALQRLAFSPDSSTLAVAGDDGTVTLWRVH